VQHGALVLDAFLGLPANDRHLQCIGYQLGALMISNRPATIGHEYASITAAQYTFPSSVRCSVISVIHRKFGASTVN
jgi:hypothetical protein